MCHLSISQTFPQKLISIEVAIVRERIGISHCTLQGEFLVKMIGTGNVNRWDF
jgi:hypothetical protein